MSGGAAESSVVSSLPLPPSQYISLYTDDNIRRGRAPLKPSLSVIGDTYSMFGTEFHSDDLIIRSLENQGLKRLYPQNYDHKRELKKLNVSLLVGFLDTLDILIRAPDSPKREEKLADINLLFTHMHHLINEFRPHQARETLRVMLELQRRQRNEVAERFERQLNRVTELLHSSLERLPCADSIETDVKAVLPIDAVLPSNDAEKCKQSNDPCSNLDRLMCYIIDQL